MINPVLRSMQNRCRLEAVLRCPLTVRGLSHRTLRYIQLKSFIFGGMLTDDARNRYTNSALLLPSERVSKEPFQRAGCWGLLRLEAVIQYQN